MYLLETGDEKIRVCELREGDIFLLHKREYRAKGIKNGRLYISNFYRHTFSSGDNDVSIGANSRQWVERIGRIVTDARFDDVIPGNAKVSRI